MRIARSMGGIEALLPQGIDSMLDLPHPIFTAIRSGSVLVSFDELPKDEQPPRWMYDDNEALRDWFVEVERKRDAELAKAGGGSGSIKDQPIDEPNGGTPRRNGAVAAMFGS